MPEGLGIGLKLCPFGLDVGPSEAAFSGMDPDKPPSAGKPVSRTAREIRLEREAAALRANLRKRKDQARAREAEPGDGPKPE